MYLSRYMSTSDRLAWRVERALAHVIGSPTDLELANDGETSFTAPPEDEAALLAALAEEAGTISSDDLLSRLR